MSFKLLIQERKKLNVPIPPEILAQKKAQWLQHEKELDAIQGFFKVKLMKLQKMLISHKSGLPDDQSHAPVQSTQKAKKKVMVLTNINKSIQLDILIDKEMDRQSSKYDFNAVLSQNNTKVQRDQTLVNYMDIILQTLKQSIDDKASTLEQQRSQNQNNLNFEDYYQQLDELAQFRSRAFVIESVLGSLHNYKTEIDEQIESVKLIEVDMQDQIIQQEIILNKIQSMNEEKESHKQHMQKHFEFQQKIVTTVQREQSKIGLFLKKKPILTMDEVNKYIKQCNFKAHSPILDPTQSQTVRQKREFNTKRPKQISKNKSPDLKLPAMQKMNTALSSPKFQTQPLIMRKQLALGSSKGIQDYPGSQNSSQHKLNQVQALGSPKGTQDYPGSPNISQLRLNQVILNCNNMHETCLIIDLHAQKQMKRQNIKMRKLDRRLETVNSNFLENKMILI